MMFISSVLDLEIPFLGKLDPKNQNFQFKLKFGTQTSSNIQNSMVVLTFPAFTLQFLPKKPIWRFDFTWLIS